MKVKTYICPKHGKQYMIGLLITRHGEPDRPYCGQCLEEFMAENCCILTPTGELEELSREPSRT